MPQWLHPARALRSPRIRMVPDMRFALSESIIPTYNYMNSRSSYFYVLK